MSSRLVLNLRALRRRPVSNLGVNTSGAYELSDMAFARSPLSPLTPGSARSFRSTGQSRVPLTPISFKLADPKGKTRGDVELIGRAFGSRTDLEFDEDGFDDVSFVDPSFGGFEVKVDIDVDVDTDVERV